MGIKRTSPMRDARMFRFHSSCSRATTCCSPRKPWSEQGSRRKARRIPVSCVRKGRLTERLDENIVDRSGGTERHGWHHGGPCGVGEIQVRPDFLLGCDPARVSADDGDGSLVGACPQVLLLAAWRAVFERAVDLDPSMNSNDLTVLAPGWPCFSPSREKWIDPQVADTERDSKTFFSALTASTNQAFSFAPCDFAVEGCTHRIRYRAGLLYRSK